MFKKYDYVKRPLKLKNYYFHFLKKIENLKKEGKIINILAFIFFKMLK